MRLAVVLLAGLLAAATPVAVAHQGASGVVKQRMDVMKAIATATKTVADMLKGEAPLDADKAAQAADVIAGHAREIPALFPPGSNPPPSEALPAVWQDWDGFQAVAADLARASAALADEARNGAAQLRPRFAAVAAACAACHKDYRLKK